MTVHCSAMMQSESRAYMFTLWAYKLHWT